MYINKRTKVVDLTLVYLLVTSLLVFGICLLDNTTLKEVRLWLWYYMHFYLFYISQARLFYVVSNRQQDKRNAFPTFDTT